MKSLKEQIEVMNWYLNGGKIERYNAETDNWDLMDPYQFNWSDYDYRIKEEKKTITIEKWLVFIEEDNEYKTLETSNINSYNQSIYKQIKLLDTYEVKL